MFGKFLPRETNFFDFFDKHAAVTVHAAQELVALVAQHDTNKAKQIKDLEHQADLITHDCVEALHKTFITPFERNDILQLISRMDDILDNMDEAAENIFLYKIKNMTPEVKELAQVLLQACLEIEEAVKGLRNLGNGQTIRNRCANIKQCETQADSIMRRAIVRLFEEEEDTRTLIKWKGIYQELEDAVDRCEDVANIIEGVIMESF